MAIQLQKAFIWTKNSCFSLQFNKLNYLIDKIEMDIETRKIKFVQKFLNIKDEDMLLHFEDLLKVAEAELEGDLKPLTIEELNKRIDRSEKDFDKGHYKTTIEMLKKFDL